MPDFDHKTKVGMVFLVALRAELPLSWLRKNKIPYFNFNQLEAGGATILAGPVAIIITGVGKIAAQRAANWLIANVTTNFVINLGTAASHDSDVAIGSFVMPTELYNEQGDKITLEARLPFLWPGAIESSFGGGITSVLAPREYSSSDAGVAGLRRYTDMECFFEAQAFKETEISFHVIKFISDHSGPNLKEQFFKSIKILRQRGQLIFGFLTEQFSADCISVVIPVYNRQHQIEPCLESVLQQTAKPKEIIVVDDGSTDGTLRILDNYRDEVTIISLGRNMGVSYARNQGIRIASTPWISFLDSDDLWLRDKLLRQLDFLRQNPHYQIIQCEEIWIRNHLRVNSCIYHQKPDGWGFLRSLPRCVISPSAVLLKKELLERYGCFDEELPACEDYDLWLKITREYPVGLLKIPLIKKFGGHEDQLSRKYPAMDRFRVTALMKALEKEKDPKYFEAIRALLLKKLRILVGGYRKRGNYRTSEYYLDIARKYE